MKIKANYFYFIFSIALISSSCGKKCQGESSIYYYDTKFIETLRNENYIFELDVCHKKSTNKVALIVRDEGYMYFSDSKQDIEKNYLEFLKDTSIEITDTLGNKILYSDILPYTVFIYANTDYTMIEIYKAFTLEPGTYLLKINNFRFSEYECILVIGRPKRDSL